MGEVFYNAMILKEPYSGVEVTVHQLACALAEYGSLLTCCYLPEGQRKIPIPPTNHKFRLLKTTPATARSRLLRILWEQTVLPVQLLRSHASLLHAPAYVSPIFTPCPTVLTIHDLHVMTHPQFCAKRNRLYFNLLIPRSIRKAAAIIVFSEYTRRSVLKIFPDAANRLHVIPPGLSPLLHRCDDFAKLQEVRQRYGLPASFLLFVGDLSSRKNMLGIISAFAIVQGERPDLHLILAGAASTEIAAELDRATRQNGIRHRVKRIGYVPLQDLPVLYSLAQAFVFPSHDEGFGLPPLEAMACGCPTVCSGGASLDICGSATVPCDPRDRVSIANAVSMLLDHPIFRKEKIELGYKKAAEFTWKKSALATERLYREVLTRSGVPRDSRTNK